MHDNGMNCEAIQRAIREGRELARAESAHVDECDGCTDAWLTLALDSKPEVTIPADFSARVAAGLATRQRKRETVRTQRPWGVISATAVALLVVALCFAGPKPENSWVGVVFVMLVATEIAGLALWLGPRWTGR